MEPPTGGKMMSDNPNNENTLAALILSGGQSSRMGMDKGLLPLSKLPPDLLEYCELPPLQSQEGVLKRMIDENHLCSLTTITSRAEYFHSGITWIEHLALVCAHAGLPVYISINQDQWETYAALFHESHLICDKETTVFGPLKGLLWAHSQWPEKDFLVITCDMPLLHASHLQLLISHYKNHRNEEKNIAFKSESIPWLPFPAIYHHQLLQQATYNSTLHYNSCKKMIANNPKITHHLTPEVEFYFKNFNAKDDLQDCK